MPKTEEQPRTRGGYIMSPVTGRAEGSLGHLCISEAMKGGATKAEVIERVTAEWHDVHPATSEDHIRVTFYEAISRARRELGFNESWTLVAPDAE